MVSFDEVTEKEDIEELKSILEDYEKETHSKKAGEILKNFNEYLPFFKKIIPDGYAKMLKEISRFCEQGCSHEEAVLMAFKKLAG